MGIEDKEYKTYDINDFSVDFVVYANGIQVGGLTICPVLIDLSKPVSFLGAFVHANIRYWGHSFEESSKTLYQMCEFVNLRDRLLDFSNRKPGVFVMEAFDPNLVLEIAWCEIGNDVHFKGSSQPANYPDRRIEPDPICFRQSFILRHIFEFYLAPSYLTPIISQLDAFLQHCRRRTGLDEKDGIKA